MGCGYYTLYHNWQQKHKEIGFGKGSDWKSNWIVPTHWSWIPEPPLVGQVSLWVCMMKQPHMWLNMEILNIAIWNEVCRCNRGSAIRWGRVGKYQPYPVRTFGDVSISDNIPNCLSGRGIHMCDGLFVHISFGMKGFSEIHQWPLDYSLPPIKSIHTKGGQMESRHGLNSTNTMVDVGHHLPFL